MPSYSYVVIDRAGKQIKASLEASSIETAKNSLRAAGYSILELKEQSVYPKEALRAHL